MSWMKNMIGKCFTSNEREDDRAEAQRGASRRRGRAVEPDEEDIIESSANVVDISNSKLVIYEPQNKAGMKVVADNLRKNRMVIVNISNVSEPMREAILNVAQGILYALDCGGQNLGDGRILLTPKGTDVIAEKYAGIDDDYEEIYD